MTHPTDADLIEWLDKCSWGNPDNVFGRAKSRLTALSAERDEAMELCNVADGRADAAEAGWLKASELHRIANERANDLEAQVDRLTAERDSAREANHLLSEQAHDHAEMVVAWEADVERLTAELAEDRNTEWFWRIVDADGLNNVSSDEETALRELVSQAARADAMRKALEKLCKCLDDFWDAPDRPSISRMRGDALNNLDRARVSARAALEAK